MSSETLSETKMQIDDCVINEQRGRKEKQFYSVKQSASHVTNMSAAGHMTNLKFLTLNYFSRIFFFQATKKGEWLLIKSVAQETKHSRVFVSLCSAFVLPYDVIVSATYDSSVSLSLLHAD